MVNILGRGVTNVIYVDNVQFCGKIFINLCFYYLEQLKTWNFYYN